jgi:hypothetical protein
MLHRLYLLKLLGATSKASALFSFVFLGAAALTIRRPRSRAGTAARSAPETKPVATISPRSQSSLGAVDKRFAAFVFMGNPQSTRDFALNLTSPNMVAFPKSVPVGKLEQYLDTHEWADPGPYAARLGLAPALFQYATHYDFVAFASAKHYFDISSGPKKNKVLRVQPRVECRCSMGST